MKAVLSLILIFTLTAFAQRDVVPAGTTANRPSSPRRSLFYNTTIGALQFYDGSAWTTIPVDGRIEGFYTNSTLAYGSPFGRFLRDPAAAVIAVGGGGTWDESGIDNAYLLDESTNYVYYEGQNASGVEQIGGASVDANWQNPTKFGANPLIAVGTGGAWDETDVKLPLAIKNGSTYYLFYSGINSSNVFQIGVATSTSADTLFSKSGSNPILANGSGWETDITGLAVFRLNDLFYLLYRGMTAHTGAFHTADMGVAVSSDLTTWTKVSTNPVIDPANYGVAAASVHFYNNRVYLVMQAFRTGTTNTIFWPIWMQSSDDDSLKNWVEVGAAIDNSGAFETMSNPVRVGRDLVYWIEDTDNLYRYRKNAFDLFQARVLNVDTVQFVNRSSTSEAQIINTGSTGEINLNSGTINTGLKIISTDGDAVYAAADNSTTAATPPYYGARGDDHIIGRGANIRIFVEDATGEVGIGTVTPGGMLDVVSTTGGLIVPRMTEAQRDLLTPVNGMIIYNTTTPAFNFYENGAWVTK